MYYFNTGMFKSEPSQERMPTKWAEGDETVYVVP